MKYAFIFIILFSKIFSLDVYLKLTVDTHPKVTGFCWFDCDNRIKTINAIISSKPSSWNVNRNTYDNSLSSNLNYGDEIEIIFRSSSPAKFTGHLLIEGFTIEIKEGNGWTNQNGDDIKSQGNQYTFDGGTNNKLVFKIPEKEDFLLKNWNYEYKFTCYPIELHILHGKSTSIPVTSTGDKIQHEYPSHCNEKPKHPQIVINANTLRGTINQNNEIYTSSHFPSDTVFTVSSTITYEADQNILTPYCETFTYYTYDKDSPKVKTCDGSTITIIICGKNCASCSTACSSNILCESCTNPYLFREDDETQCYHLVDGYYKDGKYLRKCYDTCKTCSAKGTIDNHNCITCLDSYNYILRKSDRFNCLTECGNYYELYKATNPECVEQCSPSSYYGYQYIDKNNKKYCLSSCALGPEKVYQRGSEQVCIPCPQEDTPYQYVSNDGLKCHSNCINDYIPFKLNDLSLHKCVEECGSNYNNGNISCEESCVIPYKYEIYMTHECVEKCGSKYFTSEHELTCYEDCSDSADYPIENKDGNICVDRCIGVNKYLYEDDSYKKQCVNKCPDDKPYFKRLGEHKDIRECTNYCLPQYIDPSNNECITNCVDSKNKYIDCDLIHCTDECSGDCRYISSDGLHCVKECNPHEVLINNERCASECDKTSLYPYLDEKNCVKECNGKYTYKEEFLCLETCVYNDRIKYDYKKNNKVAYCVESCLNTDKPLTEQNGTCTTRCDDDRLSLPPNNFCVDVCSGDYNFKYQKQCVSECPLSFRFNDNGNCVKDCPKTNPYVDIDGLTCVYSCAPYYEINDNTEHCVKECPFNYPYVYKRGLSITDRKECLASCPTGTKYVDNKHECIDTCEGTTTPYYIKIGNKHYCTASCKQYGKFLKEGSCVDKCGKYINPDNNECVDDCSSTPHPYLDTEDKHCVNLCNRNYIFYSQTRKECYSSCHDTNVKMKLIADGSRHCVDICESTSEYYLNYKSNKGDECVNECNASTLPYISYKGDTCIQSCATDIGKKTYLITGTNQCVESCSGDYKYYVGKEYRCIDSCDNDFIVVKDNKYYCESSCPTDKPYKLSLASGIQCVESCAGATETKMYPFVNPADNTCIEQCEPEQFIYEHGGEKKCYTVCPPEASFEGENGKCLSSCNSGTMKYKYKGKCLSQCPNEAIYYDENNNCLPSCEYDGLYRYGDSFKCVNTCKGDFPLRLEYENKCINKCPSTHKLYEEKKLCTQSCPEENLYTLNIDGNMKCVKQCKGQVKEYINSLTYECISSCESDPNVPFEEVDTKTCLIDCNAWTVVPTYAIYETKQCVSKCPQNYPYILNKNNNMQCVSDCIHNPYTLVYKNEDETQMECLQNCEDSLYGAEFTYYTKCVIQCPDLTKVNENNECLFDLQFGDIIDGFITSGFTKNQINQVLDEIVLLLKDKNMPIKGTDFILQVYSTDDPFAPHDLISDLDFSECEMKLRRCHNIELNEEIIIAKFDYVNTFSYTNQIEYINLKKYNIGASLFITSPLFYIDK